jgi:hypothetical protein
MKSALNTILRRAKSPGQDAHYSFPRFALIMATLVIAPVTSIFGQQAERPQTQPGAESSAIMKSTSPGDLVARVVKNELAAHDQGHFLYRDWEKTPAGSKTQEVIETVDGRVSRLIALNDQPLTSEQRAKEETRLQGLRQHPELQRQQRKDQEQDARKVERMFSELPKAFVYEYDGVESDESGELVRLRFSPNPSYSPPSHEMAVFKGMSGRIWLDVAHYRLASIEGTLFREVNFGWGILAHLNKGGHFYVQQSRIGPNRWEATSTNIQFTGKALFFKTINLHEVEKLSDFRQVPDGLTLAQGVALLEKSQEQVAINVEHK